MFTTVLLTKYFYFLLQNDAVIFDILNIHQFQRVQDDMCIQLRYFLGVSLLEICNYRYSIRVSQLPDLVYYTKLDLIELKKRKKKLSLSLCFSSLTYAPLVCRKCTKKRIERREIIAEIVETEEKYGRDLRIILDEFYKPMLVAGLLSPEQLSSIFLNVGELLEHNTVLAEKLRDGYEIAIEQGDEDLLTFNVGKIFLDSTPMLHAFESYCTRQVSKLFKMILNEIHIGLICLF